MVYLADGDPSYPDGNGGIVGLQLICVVPHPMVEIVDLVEMVWFS